MAEEIQAQGLTDAQVVDVLMRKYQMLRSEIDLLLNHYRAYLRNFNLILAAAGSVFTYMISKGIYFDSFVDHWRVWTIGFFCLSLVTNYLFLGIADNIFNVNVVGERLSIIEEQVNQLAKKRLLVWDSESIAAKTFAKPFPAPWVLNPTYLLHPIGMFLFLIVALFIPLYGYYELLNVSSFINFPWYASDKLFCMLAAINIIVSILAIFSHFGIVLGFKTALLPEIRAMLRKPLK